MNWKYFGLELASTETYRNNAKSISDVEELKDDRDSFQFINLAAPCIRPECVHDVKQILSNTIGNNEEIILDMPSTIIIQDSNNRKKLNGSDLLELLSEVEEQIIVGGEGVLSHNVSCKPEWVILQALSVPPTSIRNQFPDLTHKLVDIIHLNNRLSDSINSNEPQLIIEDLWELLQYHITTYFDNQTNGIPPARHHTGRPLNTLAQIMNSTQSD